MRRRNDRLTLLNLKNEFYVHNNIYKCKKSQSIIYILVLPGTLVQLIMVFGGHKIHDNKAAMNAVDISCAFVFIPVVSGTFFSKLRLHTVELRAARMTLSRNTGIYSRIMYVNAYNDGGTHEYCSYVNNFMILFTFYTTAIYI